MDLRPELVFFGQIWAILLGSGPLCLNLGHFAYIWAILLGFGRIWVRISPKGDEALMGGTPIQEHSISDYDGDNGLNLLILVSITFPENFIVLNELNQKAYWV